MSPTPCDRIQYGFDRAGNRIWHESLVAPASKKQDEFYNYDGLSQLSQLSRGDINSNHTAISGTPALQENWKFDPTGNWHQDGSSSSTSGGGYTTRVDGTVSLDQNRQNQHRN